MLLSLRKKLRISFRFRFVKSKPPIVQDKRNINRNFESYYIFQVQKQNTKKRKCLNIMFRGTNCVSTLCLQCIASHVIIYYYLVFTYNTKQYS